MIGRGGYNVMIQIDGGVDTGNARELVEAGVNVLVAGNAVFASPDPEEAIRKLKLFAE